MDIDRYEDLKSALNAAFINYNGENTSPFTPRFLYNDKDSHLKIIDTLRNELRNCDEFYFSVAFITKSGYQLLKETFKELKEKNVKGQILTTDYLVFTDPDVLLDIKEYFPNIKVKIFKTLKDSNNGFHTKGYIFKKKKWESDVYKAIIGSSNLTDTALSVNKEWNAELISTSNGQFIFELLKEFNSLWGKASDLDDYIEEYKRIYNEQKSVAASKPLLHLNEIELKPNKMQIGFINRLKQLYDNGNKRGLLISATGTGKTFASAFGIREIKPKRILFLAHRSQLLLQAIKSYKMVLPHSLKFSIYVGDKSLTKKVEDVYQFDIKKQDECDILFSTCELIGKQANLEQIKIDLFDFIVIDEVHKAGSPTYKRILNHFKPKFVLGMSATPERSDDANAIYDMFSNNVIYEIRLSDALEENLLCPFHYYGVTDLKWVDDEKYEKKDFVRLFNNERISYIIKYAKFYGFSGNRLKGLIFVSGKEDGIILSEKLNENGYKTTFLSGEDDALKRNTAIEKLEKDNIDDGNYLDYIITIDIFNEGIDIPSVNQVIFLRPTKSSIIFIQQLGRGLRRSEGKEFVNIIDFIGNYENNYMIVKAFGGDKEKGRTRVVNGGNLPGISTIEFDEIARAKILKSISRSSFDTKKDLKNEVIRLANKIYRVPSYNDYLDYSDFNPDRIIKKYGSYYSFLKLIENDLPSFIKLPSFTLKEEEFLIEASSNLGGGIRIEEPLLLKNLINGGDYFSFEKELNEKYKKSISPVKLKCIKKIMMGKWDINSSFSFTDNNLNLTSNNIELLNNTKFKEELNSLLGYFIRKNELFYSSRYKQTDMCLNSQYSYKDICQLLNYDSNLTSVLGGYRYNKETNTFPIFVNYEKNPNLNSTKYEDKFINKKIFSWESKKDRTIESKELSPLLNSKTNNVAIYLFVRKNNIDRGNEAKKFYFLGQLGVASTPKTVTKLIKENSKERKINYVDMQFYLYDELRQDIYDYLEANLAEEDPNENN